MRKSRLTTLVYGFLVSLAVSGCEWVDRANVASDGSQAEWANSREPSLSGDGRYLAFSSLAGNLVPGDFNSDYDIFVRDILESTTTRISVAPDGTNVYGDSTLPSIAHDGRVVAFRSGSGSLVPPDTNINQDIFVRDLETGTTIRVSENSQGAGGDRDSDDPALSANGNVVVFQSSSTNLVDENINGYRDIYLFNIQSGTIARISNASDGGASNGNSDSAKVSADGRYVTYKSTGKNIVPWTNSYSQVVLYDSQTGITSLISKAPDGAEGNSSSYAPLISADGRFVVFGSFASNLIPDDTNGGRDIFVHDTQTGTTTKAVDGSGGIQIENLALSADGRYIGFWSAADNRVPGDTNGIADAFVYDREKDVTKATHIAAADSPIFIYNDAVTFSGDGTYVAYTSLANDIVEGDTNGYADIFVSVVQGLEITSVFPDQLPIGATTAITITGAGFAEGNVIPWIQGATAENIIVVDDNTLTLDIVIPNDRDSGAKLLTISRPGTGPGVLTGTAATCSNCVTMF